MADDKQGRDKQAHDAERRQRKREIATALERGDEPEPPVDPEELAEFEDDLESLSFPATGTEVVATVGERDVQSVLGRHAVEQLIPDTDAETFDSPAAVRERVQQPTVAAAMKRIVEASAALADDDLSESRREAYERTLEEVHAIDADEDDEGGVEVVTDWILERIEERGELPGSRAVRRRAAKFCREHGYEVHDDEWLGV